MIYIAVDPGATGSISAIDSDGLLILCEDLVMIGQGKCRWVDADELSDQLGRCRDGRPARIYVERAQPMPKQGLSSTFNYGITTGSILATCQRAGLPLELIPAVTWKRAMGLDSNKNLSLDRARLLFPAASLTRAKDHDRAESLLLAEYARTRHIQGTSS